METWLAALTLGFAGSLHCLGMCSPLLLAVTAKRKPVTLSKALYNTGRILTYGVLGAAVGAIGYLLNITLFQQYVSLAFGVVLIIAGASGVGAVRIPWLTPLMNRVTTFLKVAFSGFLNNTNPLSVLALGMLNGLLPCGLTYLALAYCVTLTPVTGFFYMLTFGAATLPVMLGFTSIFSVLINKFKLSTRHVITAFLIIAGVTLIARSYIDMSHHAATDDGITICR